MNEFSFHASSFRDKNGQIFLKHKEIFRTVNFSYRENYDLFKKSGLYSDLAKNNLIIKHSEINPSVFQLGPEVYKVLKPEFIPFISYPYEWSYEMLYRASILTLEIQIKALEYKMSLKDASAFNIQFIGTTPVFIDTLSFEKLDEQKPWIAYRQFCRHFLGPLTLMKFKGLDLGKLQGLYLDGIPLEIVVRLLPFKSYFNFHIFLHLFLHQFGGRKLEKNGLNSQVKKLREIDIQNLILSLKDAVESLKIKQNKSGWSQYYYDNNYSKIAFESKKAIIAKLCERLKPRITADLGSNTGFFSRIAAQYSDHVISVDFDPTTVNINYLNSKANKINNILPLCIDLNNPTPAIGWMGQERDNFLSRLDSDCTLALALVHHMYFSNNLSFSQIALFFRKSGDSLIIEFIQPSDSQIKRLIGFRTDDIGTYNEENFRREFGNYFEIIEKLPIKDSERIIYLMKRRNG